MISASYNTKGNNKREGTQKFLQNLTPAIYQSLHVLLPQENTGGKYIRTLKLRDPKDLVLGLSGPVIQD